MVVVVLLLIAVVLGGGAWFLSSRNSKKSQEEREAQQLADAQADARRWIERLGGQVMHISGTDTASQQAMADASERFTAANSAISRATTVKQANLARESALEGMHYVNAAREIMDMDPGPELPPLEGQRAAGKVTEKRTVDANGERLTASPYASSETPNFYPGGTVAGRPVPAGWYSRPWWADALQTGVWVMGYSMMFNALFAGMSGVGYSAAAAENGNWGNAEGGDGMDGADGGGDFGDAGLAGDMGGDVGGGDAGDGGGFFDGMFDFDF
ncbi:DUF1542 domain-containing protein [Corynebacterium macginleyi]|uniref:DUF1542 domain-containing protein n=1 Tax=Corynebacterium macginleyi TaxID=38290 RepID=A0A3M0H2B9_9CORY|nr:DUF1542 domain-containing protein [Corynebacterium macginleyi]MBK4141380.1 DUF1542 domain-containing protein [Corynebacterium macginleyi]MBK4145031.1 DUF1542 domain-containing protein [Corynebacterium macginleyi]MBK4151388.1 DUF1542 domain-containing protein [Corynebacterium macginleyi]MBK4153622.1 DUF1542 domain-containing protein [Corynebacterium macginleyi]MBK4157926.1 DUF1542 domain-containing protein [Corynebacterium macginleyi]